MKETLSDFISVNNLKKEIMPLYLYLLSVYVCVKKKQICQKIHLNKTTTTTATKGKQIQTTYINVNHVRNELGVHYVYQLSYYIF